MRMIGQRLTQLRAQRFPVEQKATPGPISTNAVPKNIRIGEGKIGENIPLIVEYELKSGYTYEKPAGKNAAEIIVAGEVIFEATKKESDELIAGWKKDKLVVKDYMEVVLQAILNSSEMHAITLAKDMNLPSPIPLPRVGVGKQE
ncbi:hypothetical protein COT72_03060 [archaeon CG10_big_fil_rev_8_21_14_0_10_43_11]|nr:MAG: hypothetical protein COT72_03060 [archaeon CG10_big_fil_rev_8_21_14_0_10_43_11]